jgi:cytochrome P450
LFEWTNIYYRRFPLFVVNQFCTSFLVLTKRISNGYKDYGPVCRLWFGVFPFFVVFDPEHLQTILGSHKHTEKSFVYKLLHNFLGNGLITSSGDKWLNHRKLIQPTFHLNILEKFVQTFAASSQNLHEKLRGKDEINITTFINDCVLDILNGMWKLNEKTFSMQLNFFMSNVFLESILGVPVSGDKSKMENSPFRQ